VRFKDGLVYAIDGGVAPSDGGVAPRLRVDLDDEDVF
jgi:hypothetical protein